MRESETVKHAQRVAIMLDEFIGLLFIARATGGLWGILGHKHPIAAMHALLMSEGSILIIVRRFDDLWRYHVNKLLNSTDLGFQAGAWLVEEIERRNLRTTANKLFAHYAAEKSDLPLSHEEVTELLRSNGWVTGQEVLDWAGEAMWKIGSVWAGIRAKYYLTVSEPKEWMLDALDGTQWVVDQISERYGPPPSRPS